MFKYTVFLTAILLFSGCTKKSTPKSGRVQVVTSNFALFDFVRSVGGKKVDVTLLIPPGMEAHSYEPTPRDMVTVKKSDFFVCVDQDVEPWVSSIIAGIELDESQVVETGSGVEFLSHDDNDEHHDDEDAEEEHDEHDSCAHKKHTCHSEAGKDPHIWLDPVRAQQMVRNITTRLVTKDSMSMDYYMKRSDSLITELQELDSRFRNTFSNVDSKTIMYAGHFAFGYFADRYELEHISPYHGFSPNAEPTPAKIAELINVVKEKNVSTIFYEELVEPRIARIITEETSAKMVMLHGIHNVSSQELMGTFSYLKGMEDNRVKLEEGLSQ